MTALPRSSPAAEGVASRGIAAFVDALEAHPSLDPHGMVLLRHGRVIAEGWWSPYTAERPHLLYSLSKTFTSTAVGFAIEEGLLGLDDPLVQHFPAFATEVPEASRAIRVRDALAMATGHRQEMIQVAVGTDPREPVRGFLLHPPEVAPGTLFTYNQPATYSVAAIVQQAAGQDLVSYLRPRLLDPLGIGPVSWQQHPPGRSIGFSGLHARTEDIAKLGLLHLRDGMWQGRRVLPEGWAAQVREKRVENPSQPEEDWRQGYGFQVWMARHGYRGDGAYGQFCVILPEQDAVLATTLATEDMQAVLDAAWTHLLPAMADGADVDPAADQALAARLADLRLTPTEGAAAPDGSPVADHRGFDLTAHRSDSGSIHLEDGVGHLVLPPPAPGWTVVDDDPSQSPVAVSGGWDGDVRRIDVLFLESPHRLHLDLLPDGAIRGRWGTAPLGLLAGQPLLEQRAPLPLS